MHCKRSLPPSSLIHLHFFLLTNKSLVLFITLDIAESLTQQDESMVGLIVHVPTSPRWVPFWKGQHWFGILRLSNGAFVNLDSRLSQPTAFAGFDDVSQGVTSASFCVTPGSFFFASFVITNSLLFSWIVDR